MTHWQVIRLAKSLGKHAHAWDELNHRLFDAHPLLGSVFINTMLHHFGDGSEHLCVLDAGGVPTAMCLLQRRGVGVWTTFLPSQAQIGPLLIVDPAHVGSLIRSLPGYVSALDLLCVDPLFSRFSGVSDPGASSNRHATTMNITLEGTFDEYWASRSSGLRQNLRRYERRLATDGLSALHVCITDPALISAAVVRYVALESDSWKARLGTALSPDIAQGVFYPQLMEQLATARSASVHELWFGDRLAASRLLAVSGRMVVSLKATYDESLAKYAPGRQLLRNVIEESFRSHPGQVFEFYTDASQDQLAWATAQRLIQNWTFCRNAAASAALMLGRAARLAASSARAVQDKPVASPQVDVYRHPSEIPIDAQRLFEQAERVNVEFGLAWYCTLVDNVYATNGGVRFFVLRKNGLPVASIPVLVERRGPFQKTLALSNYYTALYAPVFENGLKAIDLLPLIAAIRDAGRGSASLTFSPMDPDSEAYGLLQSALQVAGLLPLKFFRFGNWHLPCANMEWTDYLESRTGGLRSTIKRMSKKFAADGGTLETVFDADRLQEGIAAFQAVYAASWKRAEPYPGFVPALIETCARRGWLRLGIGRLNGQPVAAQLWIVAHGRADIYKVAYNEAFKQYSPGSLLTAHLMQHVIERDHVTEVDYLIGDDHYKGTWMSHRRERWGMVAYNPKTLGGLIGLLRELAGRAAKPWLTRVRTLITSGRNGTS